MRSQRAKSGALSESAAGRRVTARVRWVLVPGAGGSTETWRRSQQVRSRLGRGKERSNPVREGGKCDRKRLHERRNEQGRRDEGQNECVRTRK